MTTTETQQESVFANIRYWLRQKQPLFIVFGLILLLLFLFFWHRIVISIRSGEGGVLYQRFFGGTITDYVYPEGIHLIFPWDNMTIYNARIQTLLHDFEVLTNRGLPIKLKLAIRFRPEYDMLGVLHQQVGPDYVSTIIIPEVESVLRRNIGHLQPQEIYVNKEGVLTNIILHALEEAGQKFVIIDDVIIREVVLPTAIQQAIENKLVEEQRHEAYTFILEREKQEAERKRIEAQGIKDYQDTISQTLTEQLIKWQGVQATLEIAQSENSKIVIIGAGEQGLPVILGMDK